MGRQRGKHVREVSNYFGLRLWLTGSRPVTSVAQNIGAIFFWKIGSRFSGYNNWGKNCSWEVNFLQSYVNSRFPVWRTEGSHVTADAPMAPDCDERREKKLEGNKTFGLHQCGRRSWLGDRSALIDFLWNCQNICVGHLFEWMKRYLLAGNFPACLMKNCGPLDLNLFCSFCGRLLWKRDLT